MNKGVTHAQGESVGDLLALAALFEGNFSIDWIEEITAKRASEVLSAFENAVNQGLLRKKGPAVFSFVRPQDRTKLQESFRAEERARLHGAIAHILVRELRDEQSKAQAVVTHLLSIENDLEGCRWLIKAGNFFVIQFQIEEALRCYRKALTDLNVLTSEEGDLLFVEAAIRHAGISTAQYDTREVISILKQARSRAENRNLKGPLALLEMHIAKNEWLQLDYRKAFTHFKIGWTLARHLDDPRLLRSATTFRIFSLYWSGRSRDVIRSYEKSVQDVAKYPIGRFPLLALMIVGRSYTQIGQITQGMGMLDAIYNHCSEKGDLYLSAQAEAAIGGAMLDIRRIPEAIRYLSQAVEDAARGHNEWIRIWGALGLAYAYYLHGDLDRVGYCLRQFQQQCRQVNVNIPDFPYLLELCWAAQQQDLPGWTGTSFVEELNRLISSRNFLMKGVAHRYEALWALQQGGPQAKALESFRLSLKCLERSGHEIEVARSRLELIRYLQSVGEEKKAEEMRALTAKGVSAISAAMIPEDLLFLLQEPREKNLLKEILSMGQEVVTIRNPKDLFQRIISTVNRVAGAERGAIFLLEQEMPQLQLRASKNLTFEQIHSPHFQASMELIREVARIGQGRILENNSLDNPSCKPGNIIQSRICVPMIFREKIVGVLYHDNRLLCSAFKNSDLELLNYFAALAAFAVDNARAYEEIRVLNQRLQEEKLYHEEQHLQAIHFDDIIGESQKIKEVLARIKQVAATDSSVMIRGETGVGKELVASAIHRNSPRRDKPFIRVHCSALPDTLIPSELFGHEKGAFTGAVQRRIGRFELADGGTIFLDEIGELSAEVQVNLLRILETKEFERVGGSKTLRSDFRLIAATNRDLEKAINSQIFRPDLYYRINVFPILVPPLRERKEDIPLLARYFLGVYSKKIGKSLRGIPQAEMSHLIEYHWPGNVRELENIIERGTILSVGPYFRAPDLALGYPETTKAESLAPLMEKERDYILSTLQKTGWRIRGKGGTAEILSINPTTLESRMKKLGIQRPSNYSAKRRY